MFLEIRTCSFHDYLSTSLITSFSQAVTDEAGIDRESSMCMAVLSVLESGRQGFCFLEFTFLVWEIYSKLINDQAW